jgi:hypothetical protein
VKQIPERPGYCPVEDGYCVKPISRPLYKTVHSLRNTIGFFGLTPAVIGNELTGHGKAGAGR